MYKTQTEYNNKLHRIKDCSTGTNVPLINAYTFVCSLNFLKEDFRWTPVRKTLKADAVPTVFSWTRDFTPRRALFKHITTNKKPKLQSENETLLDSTSEEHQLNQEEDIQESEEHLRNPIVVAENIEKELERKLKERDEEIKQLKEKLRIERLGVCRFSNDDAMIMFYTDFSTYALFWTFFNYVQPAANSMTSYY
ncbi:THAP2 [Mytilus coruscus]|uniref:THAP2 n=1 Tax=Mytilus coruscus TaxID=42192 RepID=A0A6J7ZW59_MYTCO|nr:THAP2 [Mytilus coruscus]